MYKPPFRLWIGVLIFFTTFMSFSLRINLSIGIIGMAGKADENPYCLEKPRQRLSSEEQFNWNEGIQADLLAAYSYGFSLTGMMGGYIAENFGPYNSINAINVFQVLFNSLSVWCLDIYPHWIVLFIIRLILGCFGGMIYPASQVLISKWAPPKERGRFTTALRGNVLGTAVTYPLVGTITQNMGWRWGFHITSLLCLIYTIIFWIAGGNDPQRHSWVKDDEKDYILTAQMGSVSLSNIKKVPPYLAIFTSIHFWALNVAHFGNGWGLYLLMTGIAKFLKEILGFDLRTSGIYSSFPYILCLILSITSGAIADFAVHHWNFNKIIIRKTFITFSHIIPGTCLCLLFFTNCDTKALGIVLLTIAQGMNGASVVTNLQNAQDLAPNFAGTIFGIINTFAGLTGVITPMITAALIDEYDGLKGYRLSFFIGGIIYIASGLFFILFGSSELQEWNTIIE